MNNGDASVCLLRNNNTSSARSVTIGIQFDRIGEIDTMNEKFYAELTIEAKWKEKKIISKYNQDVRTIYF